MSQDTSRLEAEFEELLEPVRLAGESEYHREVLLRNMGWDPDEVALGDLPGAIDTLFSSLDDLAALATDPPENVAEFVEAIVTVGEFLLAIQTIHESVQFAGSLDPEDVAQFGEDMLSVLVVNYLNANQPVLTQLALLLTVFEEAEFAESDRVTDGDGNVVRTTGPNTQIAFDRIGDLFTEPGETVKTAYFGEDGVTGPDDAREGMEKLLPRISMLMYTLGVRTTASTSKTSHQSDLVSGEEIGWLRLWLNPDGSDVDVSVRLICYLDDQGEFAVSLVPRGSGSFAHVAGQWLLGLEFAAKAGEVAITSDGVSFDGTADNSLTLGAEATKLPPEGSENALVVGGRSSTRLEIGTLGASVDATFEEGKQTVDVLARANDSSFVLSAGDGDSFLQKVLPAEDIRADFDLGVGWANDRGVYLNGSGSLDLHIPLHLSIGEAVKIPALDLSASVSGDSPEIPIETTTTATVKLGPMSGTVENIGLEATLGFPPERDGNLGPVDVDLGFKPPDGVALSIDSGGVSGGGYLFFEPEEKRYAGALQLDIGKLTLTAIGLLTTELPDGSDGFSLLVIISGEFPPVQLGFGFTLNGVGGLLGVNRAVRVDPLRKGVREGTAASVLFPKNPVENARRIVSDLRSFFPATRGQHVFGPMVKLGWGTPTLVSASLAVLLELPSPTRLLILGKLRAVLPDDEAALLKLQMNALGVINFSESKASLDASLYDSRVAVFTLEGDMAMRTSWGDESNFALSVGGFNPRFDPPDKFPKLDRVSVNLAEGDGIRLRMAGYFAVTSNTVQVGASVDLHAEAGSFSVDGHLGFDALFEFDPFKFFIDVAASVAFKHNGSTLVSADISGTLSGPGPFHVEGKASIKLLFIEASVSFDATFGPSKEGEKLPPAEVMPKLSTAVGDERNWTAQMPETDHSFVSLREIETGEGELLAHPLGTVGFRERVVPLGVAIEKFGTSKPADYTRFSVDSVSVGGDSQRVMGTGGGAPVRESFAPAQYFQLSDGEKLSRPSFEKFPAGHRVGNDVFAFGGGSGEGDQRRSRTLAYESSYIDEANDVYHGTVEASGMSLGTADALAEVSAVARGDARNTGTAAYAGPDQSLSVRDTGYVVVGADDLGKRTDGALPGEPTTYTEAEQALRSYREANPDAGDLQVVAVHETRAVQQEGSA